MGIIIEMKNPVKGLDEKIKAYNRREWARLILTVLTIIAAVVSTYLLLEMQTYTEMQIVQDYGDAITDNGSYMEFADGVLKYSRDGMAFLDKKGEEIWNQSYQIKSPVVVKSQKAVAVAEQEGNDIFVFDKEGMKGEIHTTSPIEKLAVSDNGIVGVLLKNENTPRIVCYDVEGTILVEHRASMTGTGYPIGLALSPEGTQMMVSYLAVIDGVQSTRIVFYDFSGTTTDEENHQISEEVYKNTVIPTLIFEGKNRAVAIGDDGFVLYKIDKMKVLSEKVEIEEEITSVFYENGTIGFVLRRSGEEGQEVRLYDKNGTAKLSKKISGEYANVKLSKGNVLMYDGKKVCIISSWGVLEFDGEVDQNIMEMISLSGINKYLIMNANGMEEVRLVK